MKATRVSGARVRERLFGTSPTFSFELFPPRDSAGEARLEETLAELLPLVPDFVSVTSSPVRSHGPTVGLALDLVRRGIQVVPHVVCRGQRPEEIDGTLRRFADGGVEDVLALRGDPPADAQEVVVGGLRHAIDLVRWIRKRGYPLGVGAACYPEGHIECRSRSEDLFFLKEKVAAGSEYLITQAFFDNAFYFDFVERCRRDSVLLPIVPGVLPVTSLAQVEKLSRLWGATISRRLLSRLEGCEGSKEREKEVGIQHTLEQCRELLERGVPGLHLFTMNRPGIAKGIVSLLLRNQSTSTGRVLP